MTFEGFVAEHGRSLVRLAFVLSGDRHLAEDLTQIALVDVYRNWAKISAARRPDAYVRKVLVNAHLSWRRRRWTTERPSELRESAAGLLPDPSDALVEREHLRVMLAGLAPRARTVLVLRYYADLSDAAIAEAMSISESSVRATASRALATLRTNTSEQPSVPARGAYSDESMIDRSGAVTRSAAAGRQTAPAPARSADDGKAANAQDRAGEPAALKGDR